MKKTIITVVGKDTVGIIAKVCTYLANNRINILDISQTIVQGYFNMMMIVDMNDSSKPFGDIADELDQIGDEIGDQHQRQLHGEAVNGVGDRQLVFVLEEAEQITAAVHILQRQQHDILLFFCLEDADDLAFQLDVVVGRDAHAVMGLVEFHSLTI